MGCRETSLSDYSCGVVVCLTDLLLFLFFQERRKFLSMDMQSVLFSSMTKNTEMLHIQIAI